MALWRCLSLALLCCLASILKILVFFFPFSRPSSSSGRWTAFRWNCFCCSAGATALRRHLLRRGASSWRKRA
uniref:Putative secreted peptide n=1 Tax=Anopheles braziliensis TaxID=58242 RepID=A0A2M3ZVY1_9DIPT